MITIDLFKIIVSRWLENMHFCLNESSSYLVYLYLVKNTVSTLDTVNEIIKKNLFVFKNLVNLFKEEQRTTVQKLIWKSNAPFFKIGLDNSDFER